MNESEPKVPDDGTGTSRFRHVKCEVCATTWDRGPNWHGLDIGTQALDYVPMKPCPKCGRHPGRNTHFSCAGCASVPDRYVNGAAVHLCTECERVREILKSKVTGALVRPADPKMDRRVAFSVRELARGLFATDPRVQAIVNRATETETPRYTRQARAEREREWYPLYVIERKSTGLAEGENVIASLPGAGVANVAPSRDCEVEVIGPTNTPRQRRQRAFNIAWERERGLRHEAIRRAVFILRGAT
jgi:hypothetical protein